MTKSALRDLAALAVLAVCLVLGPALVGGEETDQTKPREDSPIEWPEFELKLTDAEFEMLVRQAQMRPPRSQPPDARSVMTCLARPSLAQAGGNTAENCRLAESLSRMPPCRDFDDCPAYDAWRQLFGQEQPQIVPAVPRLPSGRPMAASVRPPEDE